MNHEFLNTPVQYYEKCENAGKLVRIEYSSNTYDENNIIIKKDALVYLPYNYENTTSYYNVFYLMHGGGGDSNEIFGGIETKTDLKNIIDNMINNGEIPPIIIVTPSFYYKDTNEALTSTKDARLLTQNFHYELKKDLLPTIEKNFSVKTNRENRAFGGYSMGAEATWNIFSKCLNEFKYFLPMSGDCLAIELQGGLKCPKETVEYLENAVKEANIDFNDYKIFACVGDAGVAYTPMNTMIEEMKKHTTYFKFDKNFNSGNIIYCVANGGTHSYEYCYKYIYNALPLFF